MLLHVYAHCYSMYAGMTTVTAFHMNADVNKAQWTGAYQVHCALLVARGQS